MSPKVGKHSFPLINKANRHTLSSGDHFNPSFTRSSPIQFNSPYNA